MISPRNKMLIYMAANPTQALTTTQMHEKFDWQCRSATGVLAAYVDAGVLDVVGDRRRGKPNLYVAGPKLLAIAWEAA